MGHLVPDGVKQGAQGAVETVVPAAHLDPLFVRKKSVTINCTTLIIDIVVGRLSQLGQHINDQSLDFVAIQKEKGRDG